ncbi:hypothetical protein DFJ73DRAFT_945639 [Zopfochytrium polystomum]|nr:hypothetical protein DFJ73DRAFT_945639 [Zopfochytrium polystomum]
MQQQRHQQQQPSAPPPPDEPTPKPAQPSGLQGVRRARTLPSGAGGRGRGRRRRWRRELQGVGLRICDGGGASDTSDYEDDEDDDDDCNYTGWPRSPIPTTASEVVDSGTALASSTSLECAVVGFSAGASCGGLALSAAAAAATRRASSPAAVVSVPTIRVTAPPPPTPSPTVGAAVSEGWLAVRRGGVSGADYLSVPRSAAGTGGAAGGGGKRLTDSGGGGRAGQRRTTTTVAAAGVDEIAELREIWERWGARADAGGVGVGGGSSSCLGDQTARLRSRSRLRAVAPAAYTKFSSSFLLLVVVLLLIAALAETPITVLAAGNRDGGSDDGTPKTGDRVTVGSSKVKLGRPLKRGKVFQAKDSRGNDVIYKKALGEARPDGVAATQAAGQLISHAGTETVQKKVGNEGLERYLARKSKNPGLGLYKPNSADIIKQVNAQQKKTGYTHNDIQPANIRVSENALGKPKYTLVDWELAEKTSKIKTPFQKKDADSAQKWGEEMIKESCQWYKFSFRAPAGDHGRLFRRTGGAGSCSTGSSKTGGGAGAAKAGANARASGKTAPAASKRRQPATGKKK